jgi:two-component system sensor histidine kinase ChvG
VRVAALIYLATAAITFSTLLSVRGGLRRFARRARRIRDQGPDAGSFADRADLPELAAVAAEFDRMVDALHRSAANIRLTAEENAHAFKTPIAVIRQSLEPLRRALASDNQRAQRALGVVEQALDRLDGLVASARRLDEAAADLIDEPQVPVDLGRVIGRLIQSQSPILDSRGLKVILASRGLALTADLMPGMLVLGSEEMIETVLENLIENAVSFSPAEGEILIHLTHDDRFAHLTISDQGPGVPPAQIGRIFDRYYSVRRDEAAVETAPTSFGIGLWISRRNVEAMGGKIIAENRVPSGLTVHVRLPLAPGRG